MKKGFYKYFFGVHVLPIQVDGRSISYKRRRGDSFPKRYPKHQKWWTAAARVCKPQRKRWKV